MSLKYSPIVFAVGDEYQICVISTKETILWVDIAGKRFRDDVNGVLRSTSLIRKIPVPRELLDTVCEYTVCTKDVIERKDYYTKLDYLNRTTFKFRPVTAAAPRAYHIADAHGMTLQPICAAKQFEKAVGGLDFLILNGDVIDSSARVECFETVYKICDELTHGEIPVVFARGNHDTRGAYAELFDHYTPTERGHSYFTFRLGSVYGFVLDCGEDKCDLCDEYGGTVAFHEYRLDETDYIREHLTEKKEFLAEGVKTRLIISHAPFTRKNKPPFDIEEDIYSLWAKNLRLRYYPDLMICGHTHKLATYLPGDESDLLGHPCPIIVASEPAWDGKFIGYTGVGFVFGEDGIRTVTTNELGVVSEGKI